MYWEPQWLSHSPNECVHHWGQVQAHDWPKRLLGHREVWLDKEIFTCEREKWDNNRIWNENYELYINLKMNEEWSQPTVWIFVHREGFYTILICFQHALELMAPINCLDLSYRTRVYIQGIGWEKVSFSSSLCKLVWLHGFLQGYLFGSKISFQVESMVGPTWDFHMARSASSAYLWSITICHEWWRIHLATVHLSPPT